MAKGPGGKSVGRVSVRVVPDASRFKADLKKSLDRIEKSTVLNLKVAADTAGAEQSIKKFVRDWNGKGLNLDVDASTLGAAAHLKEFARKRSVKVDVDLTKTSLAKAGTLLASLSGARVAGDFAKNLGEKLMNLDRALPAVAGMTLAIGSLSSVALSSVGGIFTLGASLSSLAALAAPLPGILGGLAVGGVVLGVALSDAGKRLASLGPVWTQLKSTIQDNFWSKAQQPIIDFVRSTLPQLQGGLAGVSSSLGSWAASIAAGFQQAFGGGVLSGMLAKLQQSIDIASTGTAGFANAIATLGTFGSQYLPALAQWFADITNEFDGWISQVASDGTLAGWVSNALIVAHQLGDALGAVGSIIMGVSSAAAAAGGGGLATVAGVLQTIAGVVNGPTFQTALTTLFQGAAAGAAGLGAALAPIGNMLAALAPTLSTVLSSIGVTVGTLVSDIAGALSGPAVSDGLLELFQGLREGIVAIQPALPAVASALGTVATFAGALAAQLGPVLGAVLAAIAPLLSGLLSAIQPLIPVLGGLLLQAIAAVSPFLQALVPIVSAIVPVVGALITAVTPLVGALLPVLTQLVQSLMPVFTALLDPIVQLAGALTPIIAAILPPLNALLSALLPIITTVIGSFVQILQPILDLIAPLLQLIGPILAPLISLFATVAGMIAKTVIPVVQALTPIFAGVASAISSVLLPVIKTITDVLGGLVTFLTGVFTGNWKQAWAGIVQIFKGVWDGIGGIAKGALNGLIDIVNGMIAGVNNITGAIGIPKIPAIPKLATGADVLPTPGGTAVILGEGGRRETVVDHGRMNAMLELSNALAQRVLTQRAAPAAAGANITINEVTDPVGTAMAVIRRMEALGA